MSHQTTQLKKLKFILFPPARFPCNSKVAIHPDVKCSTNESYLPLVNHKIDNSTHRYHPRTGSTRVCLLQELKVKEAQLRPSSSSSNTTKVDQEQKEYVPSHITTCSTTLAQQDSCPTWIQPSSFPAAAAAVNDDTPSSEHDPNHHHHHHHHDTREIASSIRRCMLPFKVHYELEWPMPNHDTTSSAPTRKTWLQLDDQTSSGIERVRKLGFADLDVRLDDQLTRYISALDGSSENNGIVIQVLFDHNIHGKDNQEATRNGKQVRLLRLRRVYWWSVSYNLARTCLPIHTCK